MTTATDPATTAPSLRRLIEEFIRTRLQAKLDKLKPEEVESREELERSYEPSVWLADAARRVEQIQLASHILKPIHPDASGTNLRVRPELPKAEGLLGTSGVPAASLQDDTVGNAAALDVGKFLALQWRDRTLLDLTLERDAEFVEALGADPKQAASWCQAFGTVTEGSPEPKSHTRAKQLYFPIGDGAYHLLAPLFPTSLVEVAQSKMREDRFSEAAKGARDAHKKGEPYSHGYREYPNLAMQKFGGTKPQNISQLNSARHGENWLLASLPPNWESDDVKAPLDCDSVFGARFGRTKRVLELVRTLRKFLENVTRNNLAIRQRRARLAAEICDEAHQYAASLWRLVPGWSADPRCTLHQAEKHWLDPGRGGIDSEFSISAHQSDWCSFVSHRFANWFNQAVSSKKLTMGEEEQMQWERDFVTELKVFQEDLEADRD